MNGVGLFAAGFAVFASATSAAAVTVSHVEPLERLSIAAPPGSAQQKPGAAAPANVTFDAFGRTFDLQLEPNHRLLSDTARGQLSVAVAAYRGEIAGKPGSWSRIVIADGIPRGLIWDGAELFAVEAPGDNAVGSPAAIIYRLADVYVPPGAMSCAASTGSASAAKVYGDIVGELGQAMAKSSGATSQINIGAIGDFEFFNAKGGGSDAALLTRLNNVDGIFSEQLGVRIYVEELQVFTGATDPFSNTGSATGLLEELASYRHTTPNQRRLGLTHLFTGRKLDGSTVGIAYTNTLCAPGYGAGLTQSGSNVTFDSLVAAHEIGHNFGAPHDGVAGSACASEIAPFLMATSINGSDEFSGCSVSQMQPNIQGAYCLVPVATIDPAISLSGSLPAVALGANATATFNVTNTGTAQATGVAVEVSLPAHVSLESASASQGDCTAAAGAVSCNIGSIPGGSYRTVTIITTAIDTGTGDVQAIVMADADDDPANNEAIVPLKVEPEAAPTSGSAPGPGPVDNADSGGGGGAAGMPWLLFMVIAALYRRPSRHLRTS
jgi:uncharacterized repeat protein (TIGR01451 family)